MLEVGLKADRTSVGHPGSELLIVRSQNVGEASRTMPRLFLLLKDTGKIQGCPLVEVRSRTISFLVQVLFKHLLAKSTDNSWRNNHT